MKFKLRNVLITILAAAAVICSVIGITACGGNTLNGITVENAKVEFRVGDEFELGEFFTVYANYSDGTRENVTEEVEIKKEIGFDMEVAGDYQITVGYKNKKEVYTIFVGTFDNILKKIELDTANVKTEYKLGESISFEELKITSTLENAQGKEITSTTSSLKDFVVSIENNDSGKTIDEVFDEFGTYTVTISKGAVKALYTVRVDDVDISSVQGAVVASSYFKNNVASGEMKFKSGLAGRDPILAFNTEYRFGNNYTYVEEKLDNPNIQYISVDQWGLFCLQKDTVTENYINNKSANEAMMGGPRVLLWYNGQVEYGPENALMNLYNEAKKASNKDLEEDVDEAARTYSFTFSGLVLTANNSPDYYENRVEFTLNENYTLTCLKFTQTEWENDQSYLQSDENYPTTFIIDPETGITKPREGKRYSSKIDVVINQYEGERTEENPYNREMFLFNSYDIVYGGTTLDRENPVVKCDMKSPEFNLEIANVLPETADFNVDMMTFNYEGSFIKDNAAGVSCEGLYIYRLGNILKVRLSNGGVWKIILKTTTTTKTITFDVTGVNPVSIAPQLKNEATGAFYTVNDGFEKTMSINGEVYFLGAVNKYANSAQSAVVTSDNSASALIEKVTVDGVECFKFTATAHGTYTVVISSTVESSVACTLVIKVGDVPDYENLLKGSYKATDREGSIFELTFTPSGASGELSGTFTVKKTPTNDDDTPILNEVKTETYSYTVDSDNLVITVKRVSGDVLAVLLSTTANGELELEDQHGDKYVLAPID